MFGVWLLARKLVCENSADTWLLSLTWVRACHTHVYFFFWPLCHVLFYIYYFILKLFFFELHFQCELGFSHAVIKNFRSNFGLALEALLLISLPLCILRMWSNCIFSVCLSSFVLCSQILKIFFSPSITTCFFPIFFICIVLFLF